MFQRDKQGARMTYFVLGEAKMYGWAFRKAKSSQG
jgi:hypothetical protein